MYKPYNLYNFELIITSFGNSPHWSFFIKSHRHEKQITTVSHLL